MITTEIVPRGEHDENVSPAPRARRNRQVGFNPRTFASIKRKSKLLAVVDEVRVELQNAETDRVRAYLFAICFRKLLTAAQAQFEAEESQGYLPFKVSRFDSQAMKTADKLREQHKTMLLTIQEMLDLAEAKIKQTCSRADGLKLLNRFWSLQQTLRRHEDAELKLVEDVVA